MRWQWLIRGGAPDLVVVFGGWGLGAAPYKALSGADVLLADDFRDLARPLPDVSGYDRVALVAFSFGVAAYGHWQAHNPAPFARKIAVAGSLTPIDRRLGIPPRIFDMTLNGLSDESFGAFAARCHGAEVALPAVDIPALADELRAVAARGPAPDTGFDRIWIAAQDKIFPAANLARAWASQSDRIREVDAPHVPFGHWHRWSEVLA